MANLIQYTDTLREGADKINAAIQQSEEALQKSNLATSTSENALNIANAATQEAAEAKNLSEATQDQLDNIILESGTSDAEVVQARGTFPLLKDRLNNYNEVITTKKVNAKIGNAEMLTINGFPSSGGLVDIIDGDSTNPTTRGMESTLHVQRVDRSELVDYATDIIPTVYVQTKRKLGGKAWLHGLLSAIEDESMTNPQTVAVAGMAYAVGNASIWGIYGDAVTYNPDATITGGEFDASNMGADHPYNYSNPKTMPFACGVWITAAGDYKCSFGLGIGGNFDCGISLLSGETFGIDIQSQPETLINFKNGANYETGGIGLNTGAFAYYGTAQNQGAIHLWKNRFCFGFGGGYFAVNNDETLLEFWYGGQRRGYIELNGTDHAL